MTTALIVILALEGIGTVLQAAIIRELRSITRTLGKHDTRIQVLEIWSGRP